MKFLTSLCLIASLATIAWASSAAWGRRNSTDYLLLRENVVRTPLKNNYWSVNVQFPKSVRYGWKTKQIKVEWWEGEVQELYWEIENFNRWKLITNKNLIYTEICFKYCKDVIVPPCESFQCLSSYYR